MMASFLDSDLCSDLTIKCKTRAWDVYYSVVCLQSKPFAAAVSDTSNFQVCFCSITLLVSITLLLSIDLLVSISYLHVGRKLPLV